MELQVPHTSLSLFTFMHWRRKWQSPPVFLPGESTRWEPGGLPSMGLHRVGNNWSDLAAKTTWNREQGASCSIVNWKDEWVNCISSTQHRDEILGIFLEWVSKLSPVDESQGRISSLVVIIPVSSLPSPIPKLTPLLEISEELDEAEDHQLIMFYRGSFLSLQQVKANNLQSQLSGVDGWVAQCHESALHNFS